MTTNKKEEKEKCISLNWGPCALFWWFCILFRICMKYKYIYIYDLDLQNLYGRYQIHNWKYIHNLILDIWFPEKSVSKLTEIKTKFADVCQDKLSGECNRDYNIKDKRLSGWKYSFQSTKISKNNLRYSINTY